MALKRKRSTPTFTSPLYNDSAISNSLPFFYAQSKPTPPEALYQKPTWSFPTYSSSSPGSPGTHHPHSRDLGSRLDSRTQKRHRDDRPDEQSIYASTISRLYEAQRQYPHAEPALRQQPVVPSPEPAQRSTLHSFWTIGSAPQPQPPMTVPRDMDATPQVSSSETRCEDCEGILLQGDDAMELDTGVLEQETACYDCRRQVCDRCAVLGNKRICLACATTGR